MDIESIESQYGTVLQDQYTGKIFNDGKLIVVGFAGKFYPGRKRYVVKCLECAEDEELYGNGHFISTLGSLLHDILPCGCSGKVNWTKEQYSTLCSRKANELGYKFKGFCGEWMKCKTKVVLSCEKHSDWSTGNIANLLNLGNGCPRCNIEQRRLLTQRSDVDYTEAFMKTGSYKLGTRFVRTDKVNTQGSTVYWQVTCPICNETHVRSVSNLMEGKVPCSCRLRNKKSYSYIMLLTDNNKEVAVKFGITSNLKGRVSSLNSKNAIKATQLGAWEFSSRSEASNAEKECARELECGIIPKIDMQDGYTETTYCHNIDNIIEIYEKHNGKCIFYVNEENFMPELEQDTLEEIMSYSESYIQCELGSDLTTLLLGEMQGE